MKPLRRLFFAISILLVLMTVAIVFFITTFDANQYKDKIHQLVKEKTGRDLQLNGDIQLSIFPNIALDLGEATFSNVPQFDRVPFATIKSAQVGVQLIPLLKKKLVVEKIVLNDLQLDLHKKADGSSNWDSFSESSNTETSKKKFTDDFLKNLSIAGVTLNNASIHWRDDAIKQDIQIKLLDFNTGAFHPNKPVEVQLKGTLQQKQPAFNLSGSLSTTLTLTNNNQYFTLKDTQLKTTASGLPFSKLKLSGDINGTAKQLHLTALKLHIIANKNLMPKGQAEFNITGNTTFNIEKNNLQIPAMYLQTTITDLPKAGGIIKTTLKGDTQLDLTTLLLTIQAMQLNTDASKILNNEGTASATLKGNLRAHLKDLIIDIDAMQLIADAKELPEIGNISMDITGNLNAKINQHQVVLKNAKINSNIQGAILSGGSLSTQLNSASIIANTQNQHIRLVGMKLHAVGKKLPQIGDTDTHISGTLDTKIPQQLLVMQNARITTKLSGEILSGGSLYAQLSSANLIANAKTQHLKLKGMHFNATAKGGLIPAGQLIHSSKGNIDINLTSKKGNAQLNNIVMEIGGAKLTGSAKLTKLSPEPTLTGKFKTNQFNLKQLLNTLGIKLPSTSNSHVFAKSHASFQLTATPTSANIRNLNLRMDQSKITGDIAISNFKQVAIKTKLHINQLVLDDYLAPVTPKLVNKNQLEKNNKLLPVEMLKTLNLEGVIEVKKLHFDQLNLTNLHATIQARNGIINAKPLRFNLFKGKYNGSLNINVVKNTPVIQMSHQVQQVRAENLLLQFFQDRYVSGGIFLKTSLTTHGNTLAILKQNLNGTADIEFQKGTIRDSKLAQNVSFAVAAFEKREVKDDGKKEVTFTRLGGDWKVNRGIFNTENIRLLAPHFLIKGKGKINIVNNQLDLKLQLGSKNKNNKLFVPLHIHGAFDRLNYELELDVLVKALLNEKLDKKTAELKQKLLDQKTKALEKLETRKQTELEKLRARKEEVQQRLKAQQEKLKQRLQSEQLKVQKLLQDRLNHKINDSTTSNNNPIDKEEALKKNIEEEVSDKLQDALKGLF